MEGETPSLNDLRDLVLPTEPSWWPLAPGLSFLLVLLLWVALCWAVIFYRKYQARAYRRAGLALLADAVTVRELSELLKRVALVGFERETVASLYGKEWAEFLQQSCAGVEMKELLNSGEVSPHLRRQAGRWIKQHKA
jgi:hypothetical protein